MADSIIYTLPEEARPEHIERYIVPVNDDGSLHLDNIHFRAFQDGLETADPSDIGYWFSFFSYGFEDTIELAGAGDYTIEVHYDESGLCTGYLDGVQVAQFTVTEPQDMSTIKMGWIGADALGYTVANGNVSDTRMHFEIRNLTVGTTRHGSDLWNDSLSTTPTNPPYSGFINSAHMNPVTIASETWLSMDYIDTGDISVEFTGDIDDTADVWWQFEVHISDEFFAWLGDPSGIGGFPGNATILGELDGATPAVDDPPNIISVWAG